MTSAHRRRRFGYAGCGTDLVVFSLLGGVALWGIHHWNGLAQRPLHLPRVPAPAFVRNAPPLIRHWWEQGDPVVRGGKRPVSTLSPTPIASIAPVAPAPPTTPDTTLSPAGAPAPEPTPTPSAPPSPTPQAAAVMPLVTTVRADVHRSAGALAAPATALAQDAGHVFAGLADGGIIIADRAGHETSATVLRVPGSVRPVSALTADGAGGLYWLAGDRTHVFAYQSPGTAVRVFDLTPLGPGAGGAESLGLLFDDRRAPVLALLGAGAPLFLDATTGAVRDANALLPADAAPAIARGECALFLSDPATADHCTLLTVAGSASPPGTPASIALYRRDRSSATNWTPLPIDTGTLPAWSALRLSAAGRPIASVTPDGVALLTKPAGGQTLASVSVWNVNLASDAPVIRPIQTLPEGVFGLWAPPDRLARGGSGLWWTFGGTIFRAAPGGEKEAYLPWNGAGDDKRGKITALLVDGSGAWAASDTGLHHVVPGRPTATGGYGGYVRAALGPAAERTPAGIAQKLETLARGWQGTPYKWGGDSRTGIDCSGYVCALYGGVGITVPRATAALATGSAGKRVRDELRYGDVLVFPGHCAMYTGNGWTTEALDTGVGKAAIWSRKNVTIRRFLP
jgi:cell wall-associated NlpC family hydrolase